MLYVDCENPVSPLSLSKLENALDGFVAADVDLSIELLFVDEEEIRRLNRETRATDKVTDVLSYPTMDGIKGKKLRAKQHPFEMDEGRLMLGSIVVCERRAIEQAEEYGHSIERELYYLIVHGVLHCLGYDHLDEEERAEMREQEEKILSKMGIAKENNA